MKILISNKQKSLKIFARQIKKIVKEVIAFEGHSCDEVSIHFVETDEICRLHEMFFNDPSPTDCISFPIDDSEENIYRVLGEIFVCPETAKKYAETHHLLPYNELVLYIIHGLLHLMGYDDIKEKDRKLMRAAERRHLKNLKDLISEG